MGSDEMNEDHEDRLDGHEDRDQKSAINVDFSVAKQLETHPSPVRMKSQRLSPGRTPARKFRTFPPCLCSIKTLRAFSHTSISTSLFAEIQNTPFLSTTPP